MPVEEDDVHDSSLEEEEPGQEVMTQNLLQPELEVKYIRLI